MYPHSNVNFWPLAGEGKIVSDHDPFQFPDNLSLENLSTVSQAVQSYMRGRDVLLFDMAAVERAGTAALQLIVCTIQGSEEGQNRVELWNVHDGVRQSICDLGLSHILDQYIKA